jgi:hypothetical protein
LSIEERRGEERGSNFVSLSTFSSFRNITPFKLLSGAKTGDPSFFHSTPPRLLTLLLRDDVPPVLSGTEGLSTVFPLPIILLIFSNPAETADIRLLPFRLPSSTCSGVTGSLPSTVLSDRPGPIVSPSVSCISSLSSPPPAPETRDPEPSDVVDPLYDGGRTSTGGSCDVAV